MSNCFSLPGWSYRHAPAMPLKRSHLEVLNFEVSFGKLTRRSRREPVGNLKHVFLNTVILRWRVFRKDSSKVFTYFWFSRCKISQVKSVWNATPFLMKRIWCGKWGLKQFAFKIGFFSFSVTALRSADWHLGSPLIAVCHTVWLSNGESPLESLHDSSMTRKIWFTIVII